MPARASPGPVGLGRSRPGLRPVTARLTETAQPAPRARARPAGTVGHDDDTGARAGARVDGVASQITAWVTANFETRTVGGTTVYDLSPAAAS